MRKRRLLSAQEETALLREVETVYQELANRPIERFCLTANQLLPVQTYGSDSVRYAG